MKFTTVASTLALAATAFAAPSEIVGRTAGKGSSCNNNAKQVCCSGLLNCAVQVIGSNCNSQAYCCQTNAPVGALINVALLNCVDIL